MNPPEKPIQDPQSAELQRAVDAFRAGDFREARKALGAITRGALEEADQPIYDRVAHSLKMDPLFVYGLIACAVIWAYLFWANTGVS